MTVREDLNPIETQTSLSLHVIREAGMAIVQATGDFNYPSVPYFDRTLTRLCDSGVTRLILDLTRIDYIDSSGLAAMVRRHRQDRERGGQTVFLWPQIRTLRTTIEYTQLQTQMTFRKTLEEALAFFDIADSPSSATP